MFVHIFAFKWAASASDEHRARAEADILRFAGAIRGLIEVHVGKNVSATSADYDLSGVMLFEDEASFGAYRRDESHVRLLEWLTPLIEAIEFDFTGSDRSGA